MEPTKELADALFRDKVEMAKRMTVGERFDSAIELFEGALGMMRAGIRHQFPDAGEPEVERIVRERLAIFERLQSRGIYSPAEAGS